MTRKVVTQMAARARARERLRERYAREKSDEPVVAKRAADLTRELQRRAERRRERRRRSADPAGWLEQSTAQLFARLDGRRARPGPDSEAPFVVALRELVAKPEGRGSWLNVCSSTRLRCAGLSVRSVCHKRV